MFFKDHMIELHVAEFLPIKISLTMKTHCLKITQKVSFLQYRDIWILVPKITKNMRKQFWSFLAWKFKYEFGLRHFWWFANTVCSTRAKLKKSFHSAEEIWRRSQSLVMMQYMQTKHWSCIISYRVKQPEDTWKSR